MKRIELTAEQKTVVMKLFADTKLMEQLVKDFRKSFKVLEGRTNKGETPESYIIWSNVTQRTMEVPTSELLEEGGK